MTNEEKIIRQLREHRTQARTGFPNGLWMHCQLGNNRKRDTGGQSRADGSFRLWQEPQPCC